MKKLDMAVANMLVQSSASSIFSKEPELCLGKYDLSGMDHLYMTSDGVHTLPEAILQEINAPSNLANGEVLSLSKALQCASSSSRTRQYGHNHAFLKHQAPKKPAWGVAWQTHRKRGFRMSSQHHTLHPIREAFHGWTVEEC